MTLGSALLGIGIAAASTNNDPTTFLGPTIHLGVLEAINNTSAYGAFGELGTNNARIGGTLGFRTYENQYLKVSGEYLWQKINYTFFTGNSKQWVNQGALGAAYEFVSDNLIYSPAFDLSGYMAYAANKNLSNVIVSAPGSASSITNIIYNRRIAGSKAFGFGPGVSIVPWYGSKVGVIFNYDKVNYDTVYGANHNVSGLGGTFNFDQAISGALSFGGTAAVRAPFNTYEGRIDWNNLSNNGNWTLGLFGDYNVGKNNLPNTWIVGLGANFTLDKSLAARSLHSKRKDPVNPPNKLVMWTSTPAVYMPQVLAVSEERISRPSFCLNGMPKFLSAISNITSTGVVNLAPHFSGGNLRFALASIQPAVNPSDAVLVSPRGQLFNIIMSGNVYTVTVSATNNCGSVISNTFTILNV